MTAAPAVQEALLAATSSDTVRSRIYSGKPARLLKNRWTAAWEQPGAPEPLRNTHTWDSEASRVLSPTAAPESVRKVVLVRGSEKSDVEFKGGVR